MTFLEVASIAAGLAIGYWLVSVFTRERDGADDIPLEQAPPSAKNDGNPPWHEVLGLSEWASDEEVTGAWRSKMAQYHPDKVAMMGPEIRELAERKTRELNQAREDAMRRH